MTMFKKLAFGIALAAGLFLATSSCANISPDAQAPIVKVEESSGVKFQYTNELYPEGELRVLLDDHAAFEKNFEAIKLVVNAYCDVTPGGFVRIVNLATDYSELLQCIDPESTE